MVPAAASGGTASEDDEEGAETEAKREPFFHGFREMISGSVVPAIAKCNLAEAILALCTPPAG
jgi:hypothetical protein